MREIIGEPLEWIITCLQSADAIELVSHIGQGRIVFRARQFAVGDPNITDDARLRYQFCAYILRRSTKRTPVYVVHLEDFHRLTLDQLGRGLRPMNIYEDVVNQTSSPTDPDGEAQYDAELRVAGAVTETFEYMIRLGLTFGLLTTGEAFVFLKLDWESLTLFYHLLNPGKEVEEDGKDVIYWSAVSQVAAFTLQALGTPVKGQDARDHARRRLKTWEKRQEVIPQDMTPDAESIPAHDGGLEDENRPPTTTSAPRQAGCSDSNPPPKYCTQESLLSLVNYEGDEDDRGVLDEKCPNVDLHRQGDGTHHPVTHQEWVDLLYEQLEETLEDGVVFLGVNGAKGELFQITLLKYGYTFVAKATTADGIPSLKHEKRVYRRLWPLQGTQVPVYLGFVDLRNIDRVYYDDRCGASLIYFLLLSWGGRALYEFGRFPNRNKEINDQVKLLIYAMDEYGVWQGDFRDDNILWDEEAGRAMMIDFERAVLKKIPRPLPEEEPEQPSEEKE
jgi:hypothetical protein